jgi:hypothetical protein
MSGLHVGVLVLVYAELVRIDLVKRGDVGISKRRGSEEGAARAGQKPQALNAGAWGTLTEPGWNGELFGARATR